MQCIQTVNYKQEKEKKMLKTVYNDKINLDY